MLTEFMNERPLPIISIIHLFFYFLDNLQSSNNQQVTVESEFQPSFPCQLFIQTARDTDEFEIPLRPDR